MLGQRALTADSLQDIINTKLMKELDPGRWVKSNPRRGFVFLIEKVDGNGGKTERV